MNFKFALIVLEILIGLSSCRNSADSQKENREFQVSFDNCKTSVDLKLSDLIDNFRLIRLETTPESVLGNNPRILIGDEYILAFDGNGIYKFSTDGKFIRKIIKYGRSPQELSPAIRYFLYEKANQLFIEDHIQKKDIIQIYDIGKEKFLDPVKKCFPGRWGSFTVYNDSLIMGSLLPVIVDTNRYAMFIQNFKGDFITGIANSRKVLDARLNKETVQRLNIVTGDNDTYTYYIYDDTLFRYNNNKLSPYLIVSYNTPRNYMRSMGYELGESRVGFPSIDNDCFMILTEIVYVGTTQIAMGTQFNYKRNCFFLNKYNRSFARIKSYTDDITGKIQDGNGDINLPVVLSAGKICVLYNASELIGKKFTDEPGLFSGLSTQVSEIQKNLNEMDNPVLLIGTIKKK